MLLLLLLLLLLLFYVSKRFRMWLFLSVRQSSCSEVTYILLWNMTSMFSVLFRLGCHNKIHTLGGLKNRNSFSHSSGDWQSEVKIPAWLGSNEGGLRMAAFLLCLYMAERGREREISRDLWCFLRALLNYLPNALSPNTIKWGITASTYEFW